MDHTREFSDAQFSNFHFDIDPETLASLDLMAVKRGCTIEQLVWEAVDRYILRETSQNN